MSGSYELKSFTENIESEVNRLKYQVDLFYKKEIGLYERIGLKDGMALIECGSGPGFLISNIVRDMPSCKATALEVDPWLVKQLNKISESEGRKLFEVKQASIYDTKLPDNSYDFAIVRLVMEHLKEPAKAITEVRRILKPGGMLVIVSNDFAYHLLTYPPIAELDEMYMAYIKSRILEGGNPMIGRQLPALLKNADFESVSIEIICVHSELEGDKPFLKAENVNISKSLVNDGFLKKEILDSLMENWYKMLQSPDHAIFRQLFAVSGTKGTGTGTKKILLATQHSTFSADQPPDFKSLKALTGQEQASLLGDYLLNKLKSILEQQNISFDLDTKLNDIDIDSIAAAEFSGIIKSDFNTDVSISEILQKYSLNDIIWLIIKNTDLNPAVKPDSMVSEPGNKWVEGEL